MQKPYHDGYNKILLRLAAVMVLLAGINCVSFFAASKAGESKYETTNNEAFADAYNLNTNTDNY